MIQFIDGQRQRYGFKAKPNDGTNDIYVYSNELK